MEREKLSSRLGFILISAGCAIGLGNVWRFPYITGVYGGGAFVLLYILFLVILGIPIMTMEFSVGRASQRSVASSFGVLEPKGTKWNHFKYIGIIGNYLLMMFYTTVAGWLLSYFVAMVSGDFVGLNPSQVGELFGGMLANPTKMTIYMIIVVILCFGVCSIGLQAGVERVTKVMMLGLLAFMVVLAIRSITLPGGAEGLEFYLKPDFGRLAENGLAEAVFAAMGQAFFTLSIGIGCMAIFGSYLSRERTLMGEAIYVTVLDTFVALMAGVIILPACFAYGVDQAAGPALIFITLPNIFNEMPLGQMWGIIFFTFMTFAAFSTVIAVFENIISFASDLFNIPRRKAAYINIVLVIMLSMPCVLGFNKWAGFDPFGGGSSVLDLEDFILSNNLLPIGSIVYVLFCTMKNGWGWDNFIAEANTGKGLKFPNNKYFKFYMSYIVPAIVLVVLITNYISFFS